MDDKRNKEEKIEFFVRKDGVIEFKTIGNLDEQFLKKIEEKIVEEIEVIKRLPGKIKILADMETITISPKTGWNSSLRVRKLAIKLLKWEKLEKVAIVGNPQNSFLRIAVLFIFKLIGLEKAKYFIAKEEAEKWLKQ